MLSVEQRTREADNRPAQRMKNDEKTLGLCRPMAGFLLVFVFLGLGCEEEPAPLPKEPPIEPKKEVEPPPSYSGPIDPEWPPSQPGDTAVKIAASRLLREQLKASPKATTVETLSSNLFVERGKIGDFEYLEVILGRIRHPDDPMPLVVVLHGRGGKPTVPAHSFSEDRPLRFFIPQAPDKLGDGYTWLATYTKSGETQLLTRSLSARADQLAPAIAAFQRLRPTLGKPIVTGFSQGGILSFALATRYPSRFAAAFPLAGWLPPALYPSVRLPSAKPAPKYPYIYAQHPTQDQTIPVELARDTVRSLRARGLRVDFRESPGGHTVTPEMNNEVLRATRKYLAGYFRAK